MGETHAPSHADRMPETSPYTLAPAPRNLVQIPMTYDPTPMTLIGVEAAVDVDVGAGHEARQVRGQEQHHLGNLISRAHPTERCRLDHRGQPVWRELGRHGRVDDARAERVDQDAVRTTP